MCPKDNLCLPNVPSVVTSFIFRILDALGCRMTIRQLNVLHVLRENQMSWADNVIKILKQGQQVTIKPRGHSMTGRVNDGDSVTLYPCDKGSLNVNDVVLCKVNGRQYLHLIKAIDGDRYLIGNNRGGTNGWTGLNSIYGKADV